MLGIHLRSADGATAGQVRLRQGFRRRAGRYGGTSRRTANTGFLSVNSEIMNRLSMKIVRGGGGQFVGRQRGDAAGLDHNHVVRVLHRAFDFQERFLGDDQAQFLE